MNTASLDRVCLASTVMVLVAVASLCVSGPEVSTWPVDGPDANSACAASGLSGWYAVADTAEDAVEIRGVRGELIRTITREEISVLLGWMSLDAGADGPSALAWTDSGRSLFIVVHDDQTAPDGFPADAVMRYDTVLDQLTVFARAEISDEAVEPPHPAAMHFRGRLYIGSDDGTFEIHRAERNDTSSLSPTTINLGGPLRGLAIDRSLGVLYAATDSMLLRSTLAIEPMVFAEVGPLENARGLAHSDHFGGVSTSGLFVLDQTAGGSRVLRVPDLQAIGLQTYDPEVYLDPGIDLHDLAATACGRLLAAADEDALLISDDTDPRLGFESWLGDEFAQVVEFGKGLISPDGEPAGWVIDADVQQGGTRFHPATPDGAGWIVLLLLTNDYINGDPAAKPLVRSILRRYAGLAGDGIDPVRTPDGIYNHWIDPQTGGVKPGWPDEFATLSTMKIVLSADRARRMYWNDPQIVEAAGAIVDGVSNWSGYIEPWSDAMFFRADPAGGPAGGAAGAFHEGIIFIEQAAAFGGAGDVLDRWLDRGLWPSATYVNGMPVTTNGFNHHLAAFVSLYSWIAQKPFREDPSWGGHIANLLGSNGAWTDDAGPRYMTVFSAGTTRPDWGGYNADSLSDHPGDLTTFPSLMAFCADGTTSPVVGAYHAYRHGARQTFAGGASILYRRSEVDVSYTPNTAGLPDVALGALGLAELIRPGSVGAVLAVEYDTLPCPADLAEPFGVLDLADINTFVAAFVAGGADADLAEPFGVLDLADINAFVQSFLAGCP